MDISPILAQYDTFKENALKDRFFKHHDLVKLLNQLPNSFQRKVLGNSYQGRSIEMIKWGNGKTKILLWSQMHGDEATGTMALFDLCNFLQVDHEIVQMLDQNCELYILPMLNPDGAEIFTRRSAQQIDINRDFLNCVTPEAKILRACRDEIKPEFAFTLHDQLTLWSVTHSLKPATLSFLAPAFDEALTIDKTREKAMWVIADMFKGIHQHIPGHIGLFDDEYEPRAFGDNFVEAKTSVMLIEAGGLLNDPEKQRIRTYYFGAMLLGIHSIASKSYLEQDQANYFIIPKNNKQIFHILIHGLVIDDAPVSVGINYDECGAIDGMSGVKTYSIQDIGDLSFCDAYHTYHSDTFTLKGRIIFNEKANFDLLERNETILSFRDGKML